MTARRGAVLLLMLAAPTAAADDLKPLRTFQPGDSEPLWSLAWNPSGKRLAVVGHSATVYVCDPETGKVALTLKEADNKERFGMDAPVAYSPDGKHLAAGGRDADVAYMVRVWDVTNGKRVHALKAPDAVFAVAYSADGKRLFAAGTGPLTEWEAASGKPQVLPEKAPRGIALSADGKLLALVAKGTIHLRDTATGKELAAIPAGKGDEFGHVAISADGKRLAASGDKLVRVFDVEEKKELHTLRGHGDGPFKINDVRALAFSADGLWLASGGNDATVRVWEVATGKQRSLCAGHKEPVRAVAFSANGKRLASADDKSVFIWDTSELVAKPK